MQEALAYRDDIALRTIFSTSKVNRMTEGFQVILMKSKLSSNIEVAQRYMTYFRNQWMERK